MLEIEHYLTANAGVDLYIGWLRRLPVSYWQDWNRRRHHEKQTP